ncbi:MULTISPECIES: IgaA/UmoB family intracellular growth attenuator [unclassified Gilliamella]|uniref:IgaA/UmoB family intracellular growth attenuator n=1 Tax=unclassified Gilliamella TaxID=2685620 RepID=UPI000A336E99|nr:MULTISPECIES: IgaA/UmoB family intracellular growth attenuator [unclassified Gilliamella]OTQ73973.1 hypothetical protein B6C99_05785 [Gilliamella sp. N-G2]OTQ78065.1 hypothetical protein B6D23_09975 [Gilliamella sp. N-W3]
MLANIICFIVIPALAFLVLRIGILTQKELDKLSQKKQAEIDPFIRENAIRQLTEEEILLLQPYLDNEDHIPPPYQWQSSLINYDVTRIKAYIEKDYPDKQNNNYYYKMGYIRLFFPYNMSYRILGLRYSFGSELPNNKSDYINTVEVVFTKSYAIVVKINTCELLEAGLNLTGRKEGQIEDYWQTGNLKPIGLSSAEKSNETITQLLTEESEKIPPFEIVNKREKNQFETAMEDQSNSGKLMIFLFVLGVMGLLVLEHFQSLLLAVFSIICFILAIIASHIKREIPTEYVNHIKTQKLGIESYFYVNTPEHWRMFISNKSETPIDMEVEINSRKLLSYGDYLSISEEVKNYGAPKFIKHNVILTITGLILVVLIYYFTNAGEKFDFSYQQLTSQTTTWNIDDKTNLKKIAIKFMDRINLDLSSVSCDIQNMESKKEHHLQCNKIFVNINPIDSTKLNLFSSWPQSTRAIYDSNILRITKDLEVIVKTALANKYLNQRLENDYKYRNNPKYRQYTKNENIVELIKIYNIETAILTFDDSCKHLNLEPCDQIKNSLANLLSEISGVDLNNWSDVVAYAKSHYNIQKIVNLTSAQNIVQLIAQYRKNILKHFIFDAKEKVAMLQNDENNLSLQFTKLIPLYDKNYNYKYNNEIFKEQLDYYNGILMGNNANLKITGVVTNVSYHNGTVSKLTISTDPIYSIDKNQLFSFLSPILINNFVFLFVILITLINCTLFIWKKAANQLRFEKIISNYSDKILRNHSTVGN